MSGNLLNYLNGAAVNFTIEWFFVTLYESQSAANVSNADQSRCADIAANIG